MNNRKILLVEDDEILGENFKELLETEFFTVKVVATPENVLPTVKDFTPDLVLLDISLGNEQEAGFEICRELRAYSKILPIIFFTSHDSDFDKITGLRLGADDYITKDSSLDFLVVRIKTLLQRFDTINSAAKERHNNLIQLGNLELDRDILTVKWQGQLLNLSLTQFWMLKMLVENPGNICTPEQLMHAANIVVEPNTIAAHIKNIRNQFQKIDTDFNNIKTERGVGYRWIMR